MLSKRQQGGAQFFPYMKKILLRPVDRGRKGEFMKKPKIEIRANGINPDEEQGKIFTVFYKEKLIFKKPTIELFISYAEAYRRYKELQGKTKALCLMVQDRRGEEQKILHNY